MVQSASLGFPRIGKKRELKFALEKYWKGKISQEELREVAKNLKKEHWDIQNTLNLVPSGDFTFYDIALHTAFEINGVPARYNGIENKLDRCFAAARGVQDGKNDLHAMEMSKWFDTNYHYIVPEFTKDTNFAYDANASKTLSDYREAKSYGIETKPVLLGPITYLLIGKSKDGVEPLSLVDSITSAYEAILTALNNEGVKNVQIDEPSLVLELDENVKNIYTEVYKKLNAAKGDIKITLATYFDSIDIDTASKLGCDTVHLDLTRGDTDLDEVISKIDDNTSLSLGLVDGRNIWKNNLAKSIATAKKVVDKIGSDRVIIAPSCSLLHSPFSLEFERKLDPEIKNWLAFAKEKVQEVKFIADYLNGKADEKFLEENKKAIEARANSERVHNKAVKERVKAITDESFKRKLEFKERQELQREKYQLPVLPTTTIGSFPQTAEVRRQRKLFKKGEINEEQYEKFLKEETVRTIKVQEEIGLDVLVHGEFERNDMVEYFGEQLEGYCFSENGWVQSYGSRCVKPPIIFGDVSRPNAMTTYWSKFAQDNTDRIMKGMLTGPVTMLQWSFVRDDQPRKDTTFQLALAILDEVQDLEKEGITMIQIDEPAIREGLPLKISNQQEYLTWSVDAFRLASSDVEDTTQIHTHMCYSDFNEIMDHVARMDADVISIETSRSEMELLECFKEFKYPNEIGPGVYDIHSPRVPKESEILNLLNKALNYLPLENIWVNPDCGLKTRGWPETTDALKAMVNATKTLREKVAKNAA